MLTSQVQPSPADHDVDLDVPDRSDSQRLGGDVAASAPSFCPPVGPDASASPRPSRASGGAPPPPSPESTPAKKARVAPLKKRRKHADEPSSSSQPPPDDSPELVPADQPMIQDNDKKIPELEEDGEDEDENDDN